MRRRFHTVTRNVFAAGPRPPFPGYCNWSKATMSDPVIAQKSPYVLELEPGEYWWCRCGRSATQPFCDGSHSETDFSPVRFVVERTRTVALCGCKHSNDKPYCDGTHNRL